MSTPSVLLVLAIVCALIAAFAGFASVDGRGVAIARVNFIGFSLAFYFFSIMAGGHP